MYWNSSKHYSHYNPPSLSPQLLQVKDNDINLNDPDEQCALGHSGVLCGGCKFGLSFALGTSRCMECSNTYLLLLVLFALGGIAIVCLLLKCNVTIAEGTINGLILYANIVRVNHTIFFPDGQSADTTISSNIFIAWLNLDFGIKACFYNGLDAYIKTWLQFAFPLYIWD